MDLEQRVARLEADTWDPLRHYYRTSGSVGMTLVFRAVAFLVKCAAMYWIGRAVWRLID